jgi:hypothetical protein
MLSLVLLAGSQAQAIDIFVNNRSGRDVKIGSGPVFDGNLYEPLLTIQAAVLRALPGDRIVLMPTDLPYREMVVIPGSRTQGAPVAPIIFEGNGCTIDGTLPISWDYWKPLGARRFAFEGAFLGRRQLFLDGKLLRPANLASWGSLPELEPESYVYWQGRLVFRTAPDRWIDEYPLALSEIRCGLFIHRASHIVVRNLNIIGCYQDGMQIRGPLEGVRIENCRFAANGRSGLSIINNAEVTLADSFLENNVVAGIINEEFSKLNVVSSALTENPVPAKVDGTSRQDQSGGAPAPLQPGPFVLPPGAYAPPPPAPPAEEAAPVAPEKKPSFFDE